MANAKKQHYVPQFYLRSFSDDDVHLNYYLMAKNSQFRTTIEHTYQEKYFYGADGNLEGGLQDFETEQSKVIRKIIGTQDIDQLSEAEYQFLLSFVLIQLTRTKKAKESAEYLSYFLSEEFAKPLMESISSEIGYSREYLESCTVKMKGVFPLHIAEGATSIHIISDLEPLLLKSPSGFHFITSDNPVAKYNYNYYQLSSLVGIASPGLQIFLPLSPDICLMLVDNVQYIVDKPKGSNIITLDNQDLEKVNALQSLNCSESLIYYRKTDEATIRKLVTQYPKQRVSKEYKEKLLKVNHHADGGRDEIIMFCQEFSKPTIHFSFIKYNHLNHRILKGKLERMDKKPETFRQLCRNPKIIAETEYLQKLLLTKKYSGKS